MTWTSSISRWSAALAVVGLCSLAAEANAAPGRTSEVQVGETPAPLPPAANEIDVAEHLGDTLDAKLTFTDHEGKSVRLGDYFDGERPVLLTLNYYRCPVLCNVQLNELTETLRELDWVPGENYRIVTVSIDPREDTELAAGKRKRHLEALGRGSDVDWNFLTGDAANVQMLAASTGIGYAYDSDQDQYAHPPVVVFVSPEGKIARYLYGLKFGANDMKFAFMDAAEGNVGGTVDKLILSCFHYDASIGRYGPFAMGIMRLGGGAMMLLVGVPLTIAFIRERRKRLLRKPEGGINPTANGTLEARA